MMAADSGEPARCCKAGTIGIGRPAGPSIEDYATVLVQIAPICLINLPLSTYYPVPPGHADQLPLPRLSLLDLLERRERTDCQNLSVLELPTILGQKEHLAAAVDEKFSSGVAAC